MSNNVWSSKHWYDKQILKKSNKCTYISNWKAFAYYDITIWQFKKLNLRKIIYHIYNDPYWNDICTRQYNHILKIPFNTQNIPHPAHHYCKQWKNILRETENKMANFPLMIAWIPQMSAAVHIFQQKWIFYARPIIFQFKTMTKLNCQLIR